MTERKPARGLDQVGASSLSIELGAPKQLLYEVLAAAQVSFVFHPKTHVKLYLRSSAYMAWKELGLHDGEITKDMLDAELECDTWHYVQAKVITPLRKVGRIPIYRRSDIDRIWKHRKACQDRQARERVARDELSRRIQSECLSSAQERQQRSAP